MKTGIKQKISKITSILIFVLFVLTLLHSLWIFSLPRNLPDWQFRYYDIATMVILIGSLIIIILGALTLCLASPPPISSKLNRRDLIKAAMWLASGQIFLLVLIPNFHSNARVTRETATKFQIEKLTEALYTYKEERGSFPTNDQGLYALTNLTISGESQYIEEGSLHDSWGEPMRLFIDKGKPKIISSGQDMIFNTNDDVSN